ncbi:hypothetical protein AB0D34_04370 [Streptomyces sp. NPDC048420]|uniref:hypothetical protein n=1 Tax=Streptomyces sp. NPDC048420 TaxID=3155755 RepID=UPI0034462093
MTGNHSAAGGIAMAGYQSAFDTATSAIDPDAESTGAGSGAPSESAGPSTSASS